MFGLGSRTLVLRARRKRRAAPDWRRNRAQTRVSRWQSLPDASQVGRDRAALEVAGLGVDQRARKLASRRRASDVDSGCRLSQMPAVRGHDAVFDATRFQFAAAKRRRRAGRMDVGQRRHRLCFLVRRVPRQWLRLAMHLNEVLAFRALQKRLGGVTPVAFQTSCERSLKPNFLAALASAAPCALRPVRAYMRPRLAWK